MTYELQNLMMSLVSVSSLLAVYGLKNKDAATTKIEREKNKVKGFIF